MKSVLFTFLFTVLSAVQAFSQATGGNEVEMADQMRAEGKIYVVVAVILIIFFGMILYLISLDRKISRIEKEKTGI